MGVAYLPDGTLIDYKEYIEKHPYWQRVRQARFDFDGGKCVICHKDLHDEPYNTHHLHYQRLGHERLRDVITLCPGCHHDFHRSWQKSQFWSDDAERRVAFSRSGKSAGFGIASAAWAREIFALATDWISGSR